MLAATLDQPFEPITGGKVACEAGSPSAVLLTIWLRLALGVPIEQEDSEGPGITEVRLTTTTGDIVLSRPDGRLAHLTRPGQPEREVALHQRDTVEIISEEMRRLDPDDVYADALARVGAARVSSPEVVIHRDAGVLARRSRRGSSPAWWTPSRRRPTPISC